MRWLPLALPVAAISNEQIGWSRAIELRTPPTTVCVIRGVS
jgi:hypothetical protein